MDTSDLQTLARTARTTKEAGVALLLFSLVLALLLLIPVEERQVEVATVLPEERPSAYANITLSAKAATVYDLVTKEVLYEKNADTQLPLGSLTAILTLQTALASQDPDALVTITKSDLEIAAPKRLREGDVFALGDLARIALAASVPEATTAIARTIAEKEGVATNALLANAASGLGLTATYALSSSGLDVSEVTSGGYGSARDMAILAGSIVETAPEVALGTTFLHTEASTSGGKTYEMPNANTSFETVPRPLLVSTSFTELAQHNIALVFDTGMGHPIAMVLLGADSEAKREEMDMLLDATFAHFANLTPL